MTDLFGDTNTAPSAPLRKSLINLAHGFPEFWQSWPSVPQSATLGRLGARSSAHKASNRPSPSQANTRRSNGSKTEPGGTSKDGAAFGQS